MAKWCSAPTRQRSAFPRTTCDLRHMHRHQSIVLLTAVQTRLQKSDATICSRACLHQPSVGSSDPRTVRILVPLTCLRISWHRGWLYATVVVHHTLRSISVDARAVHCQTLLLHVNFFKCIGNVPFVYAVPGESLQSATANAARF